MQQAKFLTVVALALCFGQSWAYAAESAKISGSACDDVQRGENMDIAEKRAQDKAAVAAVKTSGIIQKYAEDINEHILDIIAYRLIDEHISEVKNETTLADGSRVCVSFSANVDITPEQMAGFIEMYKNADKPEEIAEVAAKVNETTAFKPQNLGEKQLLFIENMEDWRGGKTANYTELLTELFSHSEYFYVTEDKSTADYIVQPKLVNAAVDELDKLNHKMQMQLSLQVSAPEIGDFEPIDEQQNHFILFSVEKDEQEVADTLIRKLLTRAANNVDEKIDRYAQTHLENTKLRQNKD
jgi:hypothetical protein